MKEAIIWGIGLLALFHIFLAVMCFITWENGYRVLGNGYIIRFSVVIAVIPLIAHLMKLV
ncbi:hypothetical protein [Cedecea colo]|uniref:Uncharacterized protein n=1 Tax=Cedecea colo TaxID=2552946 RepID=A0ABX0VK15_9ENTR|nr:hypothetical protein [Cedecea colo]NIY47297.1 hypothetical protein [Cedecea colo]